MIGAVDIGGTRIAVGIVDADGDQGKVRSPRDRNRDCEGPTVHPEVAAIKAQLPAWLKGKPVFALEDSVRAFGRDIARAILRFLSEHAS